ncbi:hypothetical protein G7068_13965 [Leucobacter viscericola]|uniref:Sap, sulfolipid-1-addressing protein n=1 Tax=Leucobacter viscericola TaxID=2714935 RepID=A0A6G7XII4_9MICO|nr:GAP family protein [Leucobacter viscericola]QIK64181.1 hypothetical protein G7068_13965 [Leucobacter viscericola]
MLTSIGAVLPIAVAAALSTVPILVTIALLLSPNGRTGALYFMIGWVAGMFGVAALFGVGLSAISSPTPSESDPLLNAIEIVLGLVLFGFGFVFLFKRSKKSESSSNGSWTKRLMGVRPLTAVGLGVVLNLRPKALLLAAAVGLVVGIENSGIFGGVVTLIVYTVLGCSSVAVPVIVTMLRPNVMEPKLLEARNLIERNQRVVTGIVVIMVGAILVGNGLVHLGS